MVYVTHDIEEAILLGDRILVMTARPASIRSEISVPLKRPRTISLEKEASLSEIKWEIWNMLKDDVRHSVGFES